MNLVFFLLIIIAVTCQSLTSPVNGRIDYQADAIAPFAFETTVTYSCDTNFGLHDGDRVRTCVRSPAGPGMWNGTAPTCEGQLVCINCRIDLN